MGVDLFMVTRAAGIVPAESIPRQPVSPEGQAVIAGLRAETLGVAPGLFRTGRAHVSVYAKVREKLHFELATAPTPGPKPVVVFVNEMRRSTKGWKVGAPWSVALVALDDDAEPAAWEMASGQAWGLEGVRLREPPSRVPWCIAVVAPDVILPLVTDLMGCVVKALHEARQVAAPADLGGV